MTVFARRRALALAAAFCTIPGLAAPAASGQAQEPYPSRPVTIVVPYAPGGATDIVARVVGKALGERWGRPVVVDNRPGASGLIGTDSVGKARGDPYRLVLGTQAVFAVLPTLNRRPDLNLEDGFTPISPLIRMPSVLMVPKSLGVDSLPELIALLKASPPGKYSFSSNGVGTSQQLIAEDYRIRGEAPDALLEAALTRLVELFARPDLQYQYVMQPGQIQIVNNCIIGHARGEFQDHDDPDERRHLVRLWLRDRGGVGYEG